VDRDDLLTLDTAGLPVHDTEQRIVDLETGEEELPPGKPDPDAGEVPKAFVVRRDPALAAEALLGRARGRLAGYKALHEVEFVDAIPKTASGKILRRVLRDRERTRMGWG
jgi:acyl-coenzyme A synthetase/AMP-(fatty) acid ligase